MRRTVLAGGDATRVSYGVSREQSDTVLVLFGRPARVESVKHVKTRGVILFVVFSFFHLLSGRRYKLIRTTSADTKSIERGRRLNRSLRIGYHRREAGRSKNANPRRAAHKYYFSVRREYRFCSVRARLNNFTRPTKHPAIQHCTEGRIFSFYIPISKRIKTEKFFLHRLKSQCQSNRNIIRM